MEDLVHLVASLGTPRVLVVGDLMLDRYVWGNADRISPEAPIPILRVAKTEERLGGAAGVAAILQVLDATVTLAGVLGNNGAGQRCRELLQERSIDGSRVLMDSNRSTTVKERFLGCAEQKHPQQVLRVDYETDEPIGDVAMATLTSAIKAQVAVHDIVLVSDYGKGVCQPPLINALIEECRSKRVRMLVDPGRKADNLNCFHGCSTVTPNRREAGLATGQLISDIKTAGIAAEQLRQSLGLEVGLVTLDRDGMVMADANGWQHFPSRPREVYDITGAGDVALATLGLVLACRHGYPEAIGLANVAAGLSVEGIGVTAITRRQMIDDILSHLPSRTGKLVGQEVLTHELTRLRQAGRKIVFTNGCFDILHTGHIHLLREARSQGDLLVVGLNSDASVRRLGKGDGRPINSEQSRAQVLSALECVDFVCIFDDETPATLVEGVRPDVMVKGADYRNRFVAGKEFVESYGGRLHLVELMPEQSTTGTIDRIRHM